MIRFVEALGYDVTYTTALDLSHDPADLLKGAGPIKLDHPHRVLVAAALHDESPI